MKEDIIKIKDDYINLNSLLKLAGITDTGGQAKILIKDEKVKVNGEICTEIRKKIRPNDIIEYNGRSIRCEKFEYSQLESK